MLLLFDKIIDWVKCAICQKDGSAYFIWHLGIVRQARERAKNVPIVKYAALLPHTSSYKTIIIVSLIDSTLYIHHHQLYPAERTPGEIDEVSWSLLSKQKVTGALFWCERDTHTHGRQTNPSQLDISLLCQARWGRCVFPFRTAKRQHFAPAVLFYFRYDGPGQSRKSHFGTGNLIIDTCSDTLIDNMTTARLTARLL